MSNRRSNSISNIPVRLFGPSINSKDAPPRKRSNSVGRLSQQKESSVGKFRGTRGPSLERISKLSLPKTTPRHRNYGTPSSISSISSRASRSRVSPATGLKDKKTIQKLVTNSVWVSQQFKKVQNFIVESQLFDPTVINPNNIKPPSIKGFIYLVTTLLRQLYYPNIKDITQENYKEEIVNKLKKLHYPGTVTNSTLKSVNTMHSWPQVIAMCGWLIDKIELTQTGIIDYSTVPSDEMYKYLLPELVNDYVWRRCVMFNEGATQEVIEDSEQNYKEEFMKILCFDPNESNRIENECYQLEEKINRLKADNDHLLQEQEALKIKTGKLKNDLVTQAENDADYQIGLETELAHFSSVSNKYALKKNELKSKIEVLNEIKRNQSCSYEEKMELLTKSESLKKKNFILKGKIDHAQNIKHKFDDMIEEERLKLESEVIQWNRSLMEASIQNENLKKLLLKETGFHKDQFLKEIRHIAKTKQQIEIDSIRNIENIEISLKKRNNEIQSIKKEMEIIHEEINKFKLESKQLDQNKAALDEDTKKILSNWKLQKKDMLSAVSNSPELAQIKQLTEENATLIINRNNKEMEVRQFGDSAVEFFEKLNMQIDNNVKELKLIDAARRQHIEELVLKMLEDGEKFIKFLEELSQETTK